MTILNPVAASLGPMIKDKVPAFWVPGLNGVLLAFKEKLFATASVREILFDGFKDPLLDDLEKFTEALPFIKKFIPPGITDKFAFFYQRNGTDYTDGVWNMFTGESDVEKMGQVSLVILRPAFVIANVELDYVVIVVVLIGANLRCTAGTSARRVSSLVSAGTCTAALGSSTPPISRTLTLTSSQTTSVEASGFPSREKLTLRASRATILWRTKAFLPMELRILSTPATSLWGRN